MFSCQIFVLVLATLFVTSTSEINSSSYVVFVNHHTTTFFLCEEVEWLNDRIFYTFKALRGFAAWFNEEEVQYIANIAGVTGVFKDQATVQLHTTRSPEFLRLNVSYGIWPDANFGDNVIIGLVDTGVWPESRSFSDDGLGPVPSGWNRYCQDGWDFNSSMCNRKLIGAKHFTKGFEHLQSHKVENPDGGRYHSPRERDGDGHGTHTASTAAGAPIKHANLFRYAEGIARGIASNACIATYKACVGGVCPDSNLLAAMESAIQDGVHVLSLSLSAPESPYYDNLIARGGFAAMERGIFVVCAAGNNGPRPYSVVNTAPWLTTVGAGSIDRTFRVDVLLGNGQNYIGSSLFSSSDIKSDASPLVSVSLCDPVNIPSYDLRAKIVVCTFNINCNPFDYAQIIQEAGGDGMIQLNPEVLGHTLHAFPFPLPAAAVGFNDGVAILAYIERTKNPMASFKFQNDQVSLGKERAPLLASFSSRGPNPIVPEILKPDLLAPGLNILAAYIPNRALSESVNDPRRTEFNIMSSTSMA